MDFYDQLNRKIQINKTPQRIISLVPSLTELLIDLGLEKQLVGITKFCIYPKNLLKTKTIVGGTKQIHLNKIKALKPDFILCNKEENTQEIVKQVSQITTTYVCDIYNIKDTLNLIKNLGIIFDVEKNSKKINSEIKYKTANFSSFIKSKSVKKIAYFIWVNPFMVVGGNNFINEMLKLNKFKNVYEDEQRYPEIDLNELKKTDYILLSSEPYPFKEKHKMLFTNHTKAKIILVDGESFSWYGSRLIKAFDYFKKLHESFL
jgi:ABC-type Fe3+-hydroxamate transport system substrate-binding protein